MAALDFPVIQKGVKGQFWSAKEVAEALGVHVTTVIRMFQDEPGVIKIGEKHSSRGRPHVTLRIPDSLVQRKLRGLQ